MREVKARAAALWFDVEKRYKTTIACKLVLVLSCGLM